MTSRGTTESRPGEPGYSERGQESFTPPDRSTERPSSDSELEDNPFSADEEFDEDNDSPETWEERVEHDPLQWIDVVSSEVAKSLSAWGEKNGYSNEIMKNIYNQHAPQMFQEIQIWGFRGSDMMAYRTTTPEGLQEMVDWAINWFGGKAGLPGLSQATGDGGSGRRGSGRRGVTAQDIRNQFDVNELTDAINEMYRGILFEENPQAKKLATEFVDAIVATKGEKEIDFATWVEERIKNTSRFKSIYRNKPEHLSPVEYMSPYLQAARAMLRPDDADDVAIGAAQFGASPEAFRGRLMRDDAVTGSAPYIQGLEGTLRELGGIFKE